MWNYIYFKAYVLFKDKTELTGNESYILKLVRNRDISWFPFKKAMAVKDEE